MRNFGFQLLFGMIILAVYQEKAHAQVSTDITKAFQQQCSDVIQAYNSNAYSTIKFTAKNFLNKDQDFSVSTTATSNCTFDGSRLTVRIQSASKKNFDFDFIPDAQSNFIFNSSVNECYLGVPEYEDKLRAMNWNVSLDLHNKIENNFRTEYCPKLTSAMKSSLASAIQSIVGSPNE